METMLIIADGEGHDKLENEIEGSDEGGFYLGVRKCEADRGLWVDHLHRDKKFTYFRSRS